MSRVLPVLLAVAILTVVTMVGGLRFGPMRPLGHLLLLLTALALGGDPVARQ